MYKLFFHLFVILIMILLSPAQANYCDNYSPPLNTNFQKITNDINKKISRISNHKVVASKADVLLSKLLKAKSPVIINWIQQRNLSLKKDENKIIISWREYYLKNFIIGNLRKQDTKTQNLVGDLFREINNYSFSSEVKTKFKAIFNKVKLSAISYIEKSDLLKKDKEKISKRIGDIKIYWFKNLKDSKYERIPLEFIEWGIAYDPVPNEINIGVHALKYNDEDTLFSVFSHEIGHSIDPCRWGAFFNDKNPFIKVINCLRGPESANALPRDDSLLNDLVNKKKMSIDLAGSLKLNQTCNKTNYPPSGIQKDQIQETFADWFSAEIVAFSGEHLSKNFRKDLCAKNKLMTGSSYITNQRRLESIYFVNPKIQHKLKVTSTYKYCPLR